MTLTRPAIERRTAGRATWTVVVWLLVLPTAFWAVIRAGGWERGPLVQAIAFTPYVAAAAWFITLVAALSRRWLGLALAVSAAAVLTAGVLPRALPDLGGGPAGGVTLRVMTVNLLAGSADPAAVVELVREKGVAVLALQEFTPAAREGLKAAGLDDLMPYSAASAQPGVTGSAVYSRFPMEEPGVVRNGGGFRQAFATVLPDGAGPLIVESVHPAAPSGQDRLPAWWADLASEPRPDPNEPPRILIGDFNATLDHAALRRLISHGYRDAADATGSGLIGTWGPYLNRRIPAVTIDHVLVDHRIGVRDVEVRGIPRTDHRAVLATLTIPAA